jgi:4-diphosphocytidyl-2-C-methyl-D-erythritol kinase
MLRAYAKINLGLLVLEKRPDGYHTLETVFHRIDLCDELEFSSSPDLGISTTGHETPSDERNICYRAALLLRQHLKVSEGVEIFLKKHVPVGAGLGGGSADAATVLRELPKFWNRIVPESDLRALAVRLGSDVPYFMGSGSALARGRGEILEYFHLDIPFTILVCHPNIHLSTAWAYHHVRPKKRASDLKTLLLEGMKSPHALMNSLVNDFESVVFAAYPVVKHVKETMLGGGAQFALMSGSGSSVFGLFTNAQTAAEVAHQLENRGFITFRTPPHFSPP